MVLLAAGTFLLIRRTKRSGHKNRPPTTPKRRHIQKDTTMKRSHLPIYLAPLALIALSGCGNTNTNSAPASSQASPASSSTSKGNDDDFKVKFIADVNTKAHVTVTTDSSTNSYDTSGHWEKALTIKGSDHPSMTVEATGGQDTKLSCELNVDGKTWDTNSAEGNSANVRCEPKAAN